MRPEGPKIEAEGRGPKAGWWSGEALEALPA